MLEKTTTEKKTNCLRGQQCEKTRLQEDVGKNNCVREQQCERTTVWKRNTVQENNCVRKQLGGIQLLRKTT